MSPHVQHPRLFHYSAQPLTSMRSAAFKLTGDGYGLYKPNGLWVSPDGPDGWEFWCRAKGFRLERLQCKTEVRLASEANILWVRGLAAFDLFSARFAADVRLSATLSKCGIDWAAVTAAYDGIVIAPHIAPDLLAGRRTVGAEWYAAWDCASGCIWSERAVAGLTPMAAPAQEATLVSGEKRLGGHPC